MKLTAWLSGAVWQCVKTAIMILVFGLFFGPLQWPYWLGAMVLSAWWGGGKSLVRYERSLRF